MSLLAQLSERAAQPNNGLGAGIGIRGGASRLRRSHTTVRTGPYTAVREVALTRFDQGRQAERFEVGSGKADGEGFAPGETPRATAAAGRVAPFPCDSQRDQRRTAATWCFPLTPCPCCGGRMIIIETFEPGCQPRLWPIPAIGLDSS